MATIFGQIAVDSDLSGFTIDNTENGTITEGDYYVSSPVGAESLLDVLAAAMTVQASQTVTITCSSTTGIVTISATVAFAISNFELYEVLGFAADSSASATSHVGTKALQYSWRTARYTGECQAPTSRQGAPVGLANQQRTIAGTVRTSRYGLQRDQEIDFRYLSKAETWAAATPTNNSLEELFVDVLSQGRQFLFLPDYPSSEATYWDYVAKLGDRTVFAPQREVSPVDSFWRYRFPVYAV